MLRLFNGVEAPPVSPTLSSSSTLLQKQIPNTKT